MRAEILIRKNSSLVLLIFHYLLMESVTAVMHFYFCITSKI